MPNLRTPTLDGTLTVGGTDGAIEIYRDAIGVPHVWATSIHDAFFGQGFVHAQDRLWQMEYDRRRSSGRLAEILGPRALTFDIFNRGMDLDGCSRRDHAALPDEAQAVVDAYAQGVNAFLTTTDYLGYEFEICGITPAPWEAWQCGAVLKVRHVLMGTFDNKLWRARLFAALGIDGVVSPGSAHGREDLLIIPVGATETYDAGLDDIAVDALATSARADGSNNWAVDGSRTSSGKPIVAGDPHRMLEVPNVYYQNHIACPAFDAIGISMPGIPGMFHFGHNEHVAWCVTHAMADPHDLFVGGEVIEKRTDIVKVRGGDDIEIEIATTAQGPVVIGTPGADDGVALRWTASDRATTSLATILPTLLSRNVEELDEVMRDWVDPCNNFVMADVEGTIGYVHRGRVPDRPRANGWLPVDATNDWGDDVPYDELPRLRDPEEGMIVTANNRVVPNSYPHYLGMDYSQPGRAQRVLDRLRELEKATAEDMADIHGERTSLPARVIRDAIQRVAPQPELEDWNGAMEPGSAAAAIYATIRDQLAGVLVEREPFAQLVANPYAKDEPFPSPAHSRIRTALPRIIGSDLVPDDAIDEAAKRAIALLEAELGADRAKWRWDALHRTNTVHPVARTSPEYGQTLNPPRVGMGGDGDTPQAGSCEMGTWIQHSSVARYVFDLGDWDNSAWVIPLGASGHPASPHYADQAETWSKVKLFPMTFSWDKIRAGAETRQVLEPPAR
jgi:penicillin amidase